MKQGPRRKHLVRSLLSGFAVGLASLTGPTPLASALAFRTEMEALRSLPMSGHHVTFSSLGDVLADAARSQSSFALSGRGRLGFQDAVASFLRRTTVHPLLEIRGSEVTQAFGLAGGSSTHDFRFHIKGIPLCGFQVRGHELRDGSTVVMGNVPDIDLYEPVPAEDWPALDLAQAKAEEVLSAKNGASDVFIRNARRCFYVRNRSLLPIWEMTAVAQGAAYRVRADGYEAVSIEPIFFATTGMAKVYPMNRRDSALQDMVLPQLKGDGSLASEFLRTVLPSGKAAANEPSHIFAYPPEDSRFDEVMVYAHAQAHFAYVTQLGFEWYGPKPLELKIHTPPQGRRNNALFEPGDDTGKYLPTITIDDGDGVRLQNLVSDGDVVSHEFGHHVIYKTLKTTAGESLVLHEGLADYLVFSRTNDPCLGESICPENSLDCIKVGQCLRTAANTLTYGDQLWSTWAGPTNKLGHLHGQIISGMLWDLRTRGDIAPDDVARLTLKTTSFFAESSGFCDFLTALFAADRDLFGSSHQEALSAVVEKRGFGEFLKLVNACPVNIAGTSKATGTVPIANTDGTSSTKSRKKGLMGLLPTKGCGVVKPNEYFQLGSGIIATLILFLPILAGLRGRLPIPIKVPARSRNSSKKRNKQK